LQGQGSIADQFQVLMLEPGSNEPYRNRMLEFTGINELVGTPDMIALGQRYEALAPAGTKAGTRR
jgi:hypothetical protein